MAALYIFNPEHDYALANNDPHFMPPASAVKFATDCALFLRYLVPDDSYLFLPYATGESYYSVAEKRFLQQIPDFQHIQPWGWDALVLHQCLEKFPDKAEKLKDVVDNVHRLAHRRNTISALEHIRQHCASEIHLPEPARELFSAEEMEGYVREHRDVIFKSPYSGNGRGHLYAHGQCSPTLIRQGSGVIRRQGSIMAEPLYEVIQDFAMEFFCCNGQAEFRGYSLFNTRHYGYAGNLLMRDDKIEETLARWIPVDHLHSIREALISYLNQHIAPFYEGYLGVDMFVYQQDNHHYLNPMVEINLRMTMGMAAHIITEKYLHAEATGIMQLEFNPMAGKLLRCVKDMPALTLEEGRWRNGFLALNPITENTQYAITITISNP